MIVLYRYLRPEYYSFARGEIITASMGGICFRLHVDAERDESYVTYSICHPHEVFSKKVARKMTDERSDYNLGFWIPPGDLSLEHIITEVRRIEASWAERLDSPTALSFYFDADLQVLKQRVNQIEQTRRSARELSLMSKETIEALNLRGLYEAQAR